MKRGIEIATLAFLIALPVSVFGQDRLTGAPGASAATENSVSEGLQKQVRLMRDRRSMLEKQLRTMSPASADYQVTADWIQDLNESIDSLQRKIANATQSHLIPVSDSSTSVPAPGLAVSQIFTEPVFKLSRPTAGATNEVTELILAWTEDHPCPTDDCPKVPRNYEILKFIVQISSEPARLTNKKLGNPVYTKEVEKDGKRAEGITVPKEVLRSGHKYYWQVIAEYRLIGSATSQFKLAENALEGPESFRTVAETFGRLEGLGLTLQRAVSGDDATEGAQFGFLKTFNDKTVYTADFALIYNREFKATQRTGYSFQASVQGNLSSDDSESEDALQFRAGAIIDRNLKRDTFNHLYTSLAVKYEADQKFKVGKLISENMLTPTFPILGIGIPFGRPSNPVQFRWRPYFYFDVGRSFKKGDSTETQDTVLRLAPRVRATLTLNFLRRFLNLNDTFIFADDFFYFLPLEKTKTRRNMFSSGFVLQVTKDFGFGLTYKSGEAAPKFKHVHTFGGVLTIRFGKAE